MELVRPTSGARAVAQGGKDAIAGLRTLAVGVFGLHKAEMLRSASCARDMRRVSFLGARCRICWNGALTRAQKDTAR